MIHGGRIQNCAIRRAGAPSRRFQRSRPTAAASSATAAAAAATVVVVPGSFFGGFPLGLFGCLAASFADAHALFIIRDGLGRRVLESGELRFESGEVLGLFVEGRFGGLGRLLSGDHLLLGDLLQAVTLGAGDDGLVAEQLRRVSGGDGLVVHRLVVAEQLVHRAQPREQLVGVRSGPREKEFEGGVIAAVAVELRGDLAGLACGFLGDLRLGVSLRLEFFRLRDGAEVFLLGFEVLVTGGLGGSLGLGDLLGERLDEPLDARDLGSLGRLVALGALDVIPAGVAGGVRGAHSGADAEGAECCDSDRTEPEGIAPSERALLPEGTTFGDAGRTVAGITCLKRSIHGRLLGVHTAPSRRIHT